MKILKYLLIALILSGCSPEKEDNIKENSNDNSIYAENYIWTFNKEMIPVNVFNSLPPADTKYIKIAINEQNKPTKVNWMQGDLILNMISLGKDLFEIRYNYSERKMIQTYHDKSGKQTNDFYGISKIITEFDSAGHKLFEYYLDKKDEPAIDDFENFKYQFYKGENDNEYYSVCLDSTDQKVKMSDGADELYYITDIKGVVIKTIWKDKDKNIMLNNNNYASSSVEYDQNYVISSINYFDKNDRLCLSEGHKCAVIQFEYIEKLKRPMIRFLDADGNEVVDPKCGCTKKRNFLPPSGDLNYFYSIRVVKR